MRTPRRCGLPPASTHGEVDFELQEMQGSLELGEHRRALILARKVLERPKLDADAFNGAVYVILACAGTCRRWTPPIEEAWKRLSLRARRRAREEMLSFRYTTETLDQALLLATTKPRSAADFMFSLSTFTHHRRESEAQRLVALGLRCLKSGADSFECACILSAITEYHLARREWTCALNAATRIPPELAFIGGQHLDMAAALRGAAEDALKAVETLSNSEYAVSHAGLDERLREDWRRKLLRLNRSLAWVTTQ